MLKSHIRQTRGTFYESLLCVSRASHDQMSSKVLDERLEPFAGPRTPQSLLNNADNLTQYHT